MVFLLMIELVFRALYPMDLFRPHWLASSTSKKKTNFQLDSELIYSMKPGSSGAWKTEEFIEVSKINSLGLRNEEISPRKEKFRILVLGDSFTFGHGVDLGQSYPKELERLIKDFYREDVEVINAGIKGYDFDQEYRFFTTRLIDLEPNLLIVTLGQGDFSWSCDLPLYDLVDGELVPLEATKTWLYLQAFLYTKAPSWLKKSHLFVYSLQSLRGRNLFRLDFQREGGNLREACRPWSYKKARKQLSNLRGIGEQKGFKLLIVFTPILGGGDRTFKNLKEFKEILKRNDFFFVDANQDKSLSAKKDAQEVLGTETINWQELSFKNEAHLNPQGNVLFAEVVFVGIVKGGLLE